MPVIDVWAVLADPEIPRDVGQRLLNRQRARREGRVPEVVPEADKPFLARHIADAPAPSVSKDCDQAWGDCRLGVDWPHLCDLTEEHDDHRCACGAYTPPASPVSVAPGEPPATP